MMSDIMMKMQEEENKLDQEVINTPHLANQVTDSPEEFEHVQPPNQSLPDYVYIDEAYLNEVGPQKP